MNEKPSEMFKCPICGAVSYHPRDAQERYCGRCHVFVDDASERWRWLLHRFAWGGGDGE
jgi:hypothetical protein